MVDSSWDNSGLPPKPKGWPIWAKVGLGCGVVVLLLLLTCVGGGFAMYKAGGKAMDKAWTRMRESAEMVRTDEGAKALYQANPGLSKNYPTLDDFVSASAIWRPRLGEIPRERPDLRTLMDPKKGGSLQIQSQSEAGRPRQMRMIYRLSDGGRLMVEMEEKSLTDIRVE